MTKIGIISDTHGVLRPSMLRILSGCDKIIHAGDFDTEEAAKTLDRMAPMYMVRGNCDLWIPAGELATLAFQIEELNFFLVHNRFYAGSVPEDTDVVVYGHTHLYSAQEEEGGRMWLNPGSACRGRFQEPATMAVMTVDGRKYSVRKFIL